MLTPEALFLFLLFNFWYFVDAKPDWLLRPVRVKRCGCARASVTSNEVLD